MHEGYWLCPQSALSVKVYGPGFESVCNASTGTLESHGLVSQFGILMVGILALC